MTTVYVTAPTDDAELLVIKTTADQYLALVDRVTAVHPYDVPCIERPDEGDVHAPFAAWCEAAVSEGSPTE